MSDNQELPTAQPRPRVKRRNVQIGYRRTTIMMENEMWDALSDICEREHLDLKEICETLSAQNKNTENFTSVLRVFILNYFWKGAQAAFLRKSA